MKKILLFVAALLIGSGIVNAQDKAVDKAKAFEAGDIVVEGGVGIAVYQTLVRQTITIGKNVTKIDKKGTAASVIVPIQGEYGFKNWFGLGARFVYANYFDSTKTNRAIDFDLVLNFHFIKTKRFEMPISWFFGFSNIKIKYNDTYNTIAKDNGGCNGLTLIPRFYLTDHFALFANIGFMNYGYPSLSFSNNYNKNLVPSNATIFLGGAGQTISLGGTYKF